MSLSDRQRPEGFQRTTLNAVLFADGISPTIIFLSKIVIYAVVLTGCD